MMTRPTILCVDDEKNVVDSIRLNLRGRYDVVTALSGKEGLDAIAANPEICIVVSDMRMPAMDGAAFLAEVRTRLPQAVRVLLTGYSDIEAAMRAVNEGQIFRFLTKPCPPDQLITTLGACLDQYRLITAERVLLQNTLIGCVKALIDVLALSNPMALGRASRIRDRAKGLASQLDLSQSWRVEFAALLSQLSAISLADDTMRKLYDGDGLDAEEVNCLVDSMGALNQILANIPRMGPVISILEELAILTGQASIAQSSPHRSVEARLLQAAIELDAHEARGLTFEQSMQQLKTRELILGTDVLDAVSSMSQNAEQAAVGEVQPAELVEGMVLCEDLRTTDGIVIMPRGFSINYASREHIANLIQSLPHRAIRVLTPQTQARAGKVGALV